MVPFPARVLNTIEFMLRSQARAGIRMAKMEARAAKTDKRIDSIAKLLQQGMRMLARTRDLRSWS